MDVMEIMAQDMSQIIELAKTNFKYTIQAVNVQGYGTKGDGVADDTGAIQAAVDYANSIGKKEIFIPPGTYKYGILNNTSGLFFYGDGVTLNGTTKLYLSNLSHFFAGDLAVSPHANLPTWDSGGIHMGMPFSKDVDSSGGFGTIKIFSNNPAGPPEQYLQSTFQQWTAVNPNLRRLSIRCTEQNVAGRNITLNESGGNVIVGALDGSSQLWVAGDMTVAAHDNMPTGDGGGLHIGTLPKAQASVGGFGVIRFISNDAVNSVQGTMGLITDPTGSNRRIAIKVIEQGVAWRNVTLAESGGNVGIGTTSPTSPLHVVGLPVFANNAAAIAGGLTVGAFYRTGADPDPVCVVH